MSNSAPIHNRAIAVIVVAVVSLSILIGCGDRGGERDRAAEENATELRTTKIARGQSGANLVIGDSMASYCDWPDCVKVDFPSASIREVHARLRSLELQGPYDTVYVCVGTADASFPVGEDLADLADRPPDALFRDLEGDLNTTEKLAQLTSDLLGFAAFVKQRTMPRRFVVVSPLPNCVLRNFWLVQQADRYFEERLGSEYVDINDAFFDFDLGVRRDQTFFRDMLHLSNKGYRKLKTLLDT